MPIFDSSLYPYIFTIFLVACVGCFLLPFILLLVVFITRLDLTFQVHTRRGGEHHWREASPLGGDAGRDAQIEMIKPGNVTLNDRQLSMQGGILTALPTDTAIRTKLGLVGDGFDILDQQMKLNNKTLLDVYPMNKITVRCGNCRERVRAGQGYMHYNVGSRKTYCRQCHVAQGLPLREDEENQNTLSDTIGELGAQV